MIVKLSLNLGEAICSVLDSCLRVFISNYNLLLRED